MSNADVRAQNAKLDELIRQLARQCSAKSYCPSSVYRVQFNKHFTFRDAAKIVPYLAQLGITTLYCSPLFEASPNSTHGYDVTNPNRLNPTLGTEKDYQAFCQVLKEHNIGQIADVVPNHMGIGGSKNQWWQDVLENGPESVYATYFDIDWWPEKKEMFNKVLLPILGDAYGAILEDQQMILQYDADKGSFYMQYWEHQLPVNPKTYPLILEHGLEALALLFHETERDYLEFLSLINAFKHLPHGREKIKTLELSREKENAKRRLAKAVKASVKLSRYVQGQLAVFNGIKGNARSFDAMNYLLNAQHYRLSYWRVASEEINYRRFFDVNSLAAIRMEDPDAFENYHHLLFRLIDEENIQGLRIDHTDGLYDPRGYLSQLQNEITKRWVMKRLGDVDYQAANEAMNRVLAEEEFQNTKPLYLIVEKILKRKESLPWDWRTAGTVGYDFLNILNGVFVYQPHEKQLNDIYESFIGRHWDFAELVYEKKKFFALIHMSSEINALGHILDRLSEGNRHFRDFTLNNLTLAIREIIACFPVYRSYISPGDDVVSKWDEKYIHIALEKARQKTPTLSESIYEYLRTVLTLQFDQRMSDSEKDQYRDFVLRFQQLSGPIMAKGLEDTVFYIYNRLLSLNEVGANPSHFGVSVNEFHRHNEEQNTRWPQRFITTSTHDTKRSEDVRMLISTISEIPKMWNSQVLRWTIYNEKHKTLVDEALAPDRNTEYFIYQTLLGLWPYKSVSAGKLKRLKQRASEIILKSIREAKTHTRWLEPHEAYEAAVNKFLYEILSTKKSNVFLREFVEFHKSISSYGRKNSLSAMVLKIGSPGVLDIYQGSEVWDDRFVDPDNRGAVEYEKTLELLSHQKSYGYHPLHDDKAKAHRLRRGLILRRSWRDVFVGGSYTPLEVVGKNKDYCIAFMRRHKDKTALIVAGRHLLHLAEKNGGDLYSPQVWSNTFVELPAFCKNVVWEDIFYKEHIHCQLGRAGQVTLPLSKVFHQDTASILIHETRP